MNQEDITWIQWYCSLEENKFLCEIDESFISSDFNLYGLDTQVKHFELAIDNILQFEFSEEVSDELMEEIEEESKKLYGLIHARYIVTLQGQQKMLKKFENVEFGCCKCVKCNQYPLLPIGTSDLYGVEKMRLYCASCNDIYMVPKNCPCRNLDGSFFGTTFPHLLLLQLDEHPLNEFNYCPKIFGFKIVPRDYERPEEYPQFIGRKSFFHM